jgi:hypothetical protein
MPAPLCARERPVAHPFESREGSSRARAHAGTPHQTESPRAPGLDRESAPGKAPSFANLPSARNLLHVTGIWPITTTRRRCFHEKDPGIRAGCALLPLAASAQEATGKIKTVDWLTARSSSRRHATLWIDEGRLSGLRRREGPAVVHHRRRQEGRHRAVCPAPSSTASRAPTAAPRRSSTTPASRPPNEVNWFLWASNGPQAPVRSSRPGDPRHPIRARLVRSRARHRSGPRLLSGKVLIAAL